MEITCAACGKVSEIPEKVGFKDTCATCDAYLHSCINCRFYVNEMCAEPAAEKERDPVGQNYCEWYEVKQEPGARRQETGGRETAEEMWRKLTGKD